MQKKILPLLAATIATTIYGINHTVAKMVMPIYIGSLGLVFLRVLGATIIFWTISLFFKTKPILGICLGHQAIGQAFGGKIIVANKIMHGKTSLVNHNKSSIFYNIKDPYHVMRYHSLVIDHQSLPKELDVIAWVNDDSNKTIMGVKHKNYPLIGIQFHPESIFTEQGAKLIQNFIDLL